MAQRIFPSYEAAQAHYNGIYQEIRTMVNTTVTVENAAAIKARATDLLQEAMNFPDKEQGALLRKACADLNLAAHMVSLVSINVAQVNKEIGEVGL